MGDPIFVGGSGRSGTTIVARMITLHPQTELVPEELRVHCDPGGLADVLAHRVPVAWFAKRLHGYWRTRRSASGNPRGLTERFLADDEYTKAVHRFEQGFDADPEASGAALVEALISDVTPAAGKWVEMSPTNCAAAEGLHAMFPSARFVHVVRSGLDVACSLRTVAWGPDDSRDGVLVWADRSAEAAKGMRRLPLRRATTVHFEEVVLRPFRELRQLSRWLGLPANELPRDKAAMPLRRKRAHVGRWRSDLNDAEQPLILALYLHSCRRLARLDHHALPRDIEEARIVWQELPRRRRAAATARAWLWRMRWRFRRRRQWVWRPGWRLRAQGRLSVTPLSGAAATAAQATGTASRPPRPGRG
jgi:hypothetical protein